MKYENCSVEIEIITLDTCVVERVFVYQKDGSLARAFDLPMSYSDDINDENIENYIGTKEAATIVDCDIKTIRNRCESGQYVAKKSFGSWIIDQRSL